MVNLPKDGILLRTRKWLRIALPFDGLKDGYSLPFIDKCFEMIINKLVIKLPQITTVEKNTFLTNNK